MSNIKEVAITATVPFNWTTEASAEDLALLGRVLLHPSYGLHLTQLQSHWKANENGGSTAMYLLAIRGHEALAWPALDALADALRRIGDVERAVARDLEAGPDEGRWVRLGDLPAVVA